MFMLCFINEERRASLKARFQAESLIKLFTELELAELGLRDVFLVPVGHGMAESLAHTLFVSSASMPI